MPNRTRVARSARRRSDRAPVPRPRLRASRSGRRSKRLRSRAAHATMAEVCVFALNGRRIADAAALAAAGHGLAHAPLIARDIAGGKPGPPLTPGDGSVRGRFGSRERGDELGDRGGIRPVRHAFGQRHPRLLGGGVDVRAGTRSRSRAGRCGSGRRRRAGAPPARSCTGTRRSGSRR